MCKKFAFGKSCILFSCRFPFLPVQNLHVISMYHSFSTKSSMIYKTFCSFFSKLLLNFCTLSQNGVFIPLVATTVAVTHSERWSECLSGAASSPLCLLSITATLFSAPLNRPNWSLVVSHTVPSFVWSFLRLHDRPEVLIFNPNLICFWFFRTDQPTAFASTKPITVSEKLGQDCRHTGDKTNWTLQKPQTFFWISLFNTESELVLAFQWS